MANWRSRATAALASAVATVKTRNREGQKPLPLITLMSADLYAGFEGLHGLEYIRRLTIGPSRGFPITR
jgi:hypothetical protein